LGVWLVANYIAQVGFPEIAIQEYGIAWSRGQWRGWMGHKNLAGTAAAITLLFALFPSGERRTYLPRLILSAGALPYLFLSQSRTAIAAAAAACVFGMLVTRVGAVASPGALRLARILVLASCAVLVLLLLVLTINPDLLLGMLEDPAALSGRTQIWQIMLSSVREHPFLGTGYASFWSAGREHVSLNTGHMDWQAIDTGHNGYLDIAVQSGLIGLLVALSALLLWPALRILGLMNAYPAAAGLAAALVIFALVDNLAESSLFDSDLMPQLFAVLALGVLQATARRERAALDVSPKVRRRDRDVTLRPRLGYDDNQERSRP